MDIKHQMLLAGVSILAVAATSVEAAPAVTTWTAYLYQGPGHHYAVIDEVPQATSVDVSGCENAWCKVWLGGRVGYLSAEVVARGDASKPEPGLLPQPAAALNPAAPLDSCVRANQTGGNGGNAPTRFCLIKK